MIATAEHISEVGSHEARAISSILHRPVYPTPHIPQAEKSSFLDTIVGRHGGLRAKARSGHKNVLAK